MTRDRAGLALLALLLGLILVGGATAGSGAQASPLGKLSQAGSEAQYLSSLGLNPTGFVVQRGKRNYAGPNCPGKGWACTKAHRVLQFTTSGGVNSVACTSSGGGGSVSSSAGSSSESCTIVQVSTSGANTATCNEQTSTTASGTMAQTCSITQTSGSGANNATVTQNLLQGPSACSPPSGTTSLQSEGGTQTATVTQSSSAGAGTANVSQTASQCAGTTTTGAVSESQTTNQTFTIAQGPVGFNPSSPNCTNHGMLKATASQSQHQHASAIAAGSGSQSQHADLTGHVDQCSLDHADYGTTQTEDQSMDPNSNVAQTMIGPTKLTGASAPAHARRSLQKIGCCSFQGTNTTDFCTITQSTSQTGNPAPQSVQSEDVSSTVGTAGSCTSNVATNQNGSQFSNSQTGSNVNNSVQCQQQTCTGAQAPTTLVWSGATSGTYHDPANLAATLTSGGNPVQGQTVNLAVGGEGCSATTGSDGVATCSPKLNDTPGTVQASASFAATSAYLGSSVAPFDFTVNKAPTTLSYTGPSSVDYDNNVTLTANLSETHNSGTGIANEPVTFTISDGGSNTQSCTTGATDGSGDVSCTLRVTLVPGSGYTVTAQFAGDADYLPSNSPGSGFTVNKAPTTLTYTQVTSGNYHDTVPLSATLTETDTGFAVSGRSVTLSVTPDTKGTQSCTTMTSSTGVASCTVYLTGDPGPYSVAATFDASGDAYYTGSSSAPQNFTINQAPTVVTYNGDTNQDWNDTTTLTAKLTELDTGATVSGKTLTFTVTNGTAFQTCQGITGPGGVASCSFVVALAPGAYTVSASFAGDIDYLGKAASQTYAVNREESFVKYTGATSGDYSDQVTLKGILTEDTAGGPPLSGRQLTFTLGTQSCNGTTNSSGVASCTLTINQQAGASSVVTSFTGDTNYQPSSVATPFTITQEEGSLSYTGPTSAKKGSLVTLSAKLTHDGTGLDGRTIAFTLGSQACNGVTNSSGVASCTLTLNQNVGSTTVTSKFGGDSYYQPISVSKLFSIKSS